MPGIRRVGVVGAGLMGSGIAEVCARAGLEVVLREVSEDAMQAGRRRVAASLDRAVRTGKLPEDERDAAVRRIGYTADFGDLTEVDLAVEAVADDGQTKVSVFAQLDKVVRRDDAILASNTSSIPTMKLGMATSRPHQVIGMHFFNPVSVLKLVELVPSLLTGTPTQERAECFVAGVLGKQVIRSQDRAGFVVNALLVPYLLSAIRMLESGFASADDIDSGMVRGVPIPWARCDWPT